MIFIIFDWALCLVLLAETKSENGRRRKYYTLTPKGTAVLAEAKDKIEELRAEM